MVYLSYFFAKSTHCSKHASLYPLPVKVSLQSLSKKTLPDRFSKKEAPPKKKEWEVPARTKLFPFPEMIEKKGVKNKLRKFNNTIDRVHSQDDAHLLNKFTNIYTKTVQINIFGSIKLKKPLPLEHRD